MTLPFAIIRDDLSGDAINALLQLHLDEMHQWSPANKVRAMPAQRLRQDDVTFFAAWADDVLAACGALKELGGGRGELKSMRAAPQFRGKGAGKAILLHLLGEADQRGYHWLGLETGGTEPFMPARRLYEAHGFTECAPFGDYVSDEFSLCMEKQLG